MMQPGRRHSHRLGPSTCRPKRSADEYTLLVPTNSLCSTACGTLARQPAAPPPVTIAMNDTFEGEEIRYTPLEDLAKIRPISPMPSPVKRPQLYTVGRTANAFTTISPFPAAAPTAPSVRACSMAGPRRYATQIVTGVSTGGLIAPFAFLGPAYDEQLKLSYTTIDASRVFQLRGLRLRCYGQDLYLDGPLAAAD